MLKFVSDIRLM